MQYPVWRQLSFPGGITVPIEPRQNRIALIFWAFAGVVTVRPSSVGELTDSDAVLLSSANTPLVIDRTHYGAAVTFGWRVTASPSIPPSTATIIEVIEVSDPQQNGFWNRIRTVKVIPRR